MEFTTEQQWHFLGEFTKLKLEVGEPSPHMKIVGYLSRDCDLDEKVWRAGCYAVPYSIITAEVLWTEWPLRKFLATKPEVFDEWLNDNWKDIHTRTERRCVRTPAKFSECLNGYARWTVNQFPFDLEAEKDLDNDVAYDMLWQSISQVKYLGRYINIRILDLLHRYCGVKAQLYDIRSIGGWSPRKMLALMFPESWVDLLKPGKAGDDLANVLALQALRRYQDEGLDIDYYVFAAMLCEYRVAYENGKQYPGRTHDQEIEYFNKKGRAWEQRGFKFQMFEARKHLFPNVCLGELNGWEGIRDELSLTMRQHQYVWADTRYDYKKTSNLSLPVMRQNATQ